MVLGRFIVVPKHANEKNNNNLLCTGRTEVFSSPEKQKKNVNITFPTHHFNDILTSNLSRHDTNATVKRVFKKTLIGN